MRGESIWIAGTVVAAGLVTVGLMLGQLTLSAVVFTTLGLLLVARLASRIANDLDRRWLTTLLPLAFLAKMAGIAARYVMVTAIYERGDAFGYYRSAIELVHEWRQLSVPQGIRGSAGTRFVEIFTSLLFVPGIPSFLVSFMIFGAMAFAGSVFFYLAFRRWVQNGRVLFVYAVLLFFMPSILFWPSSVGKDALMMLALGITAYGASRLLNGEYLVGVLYLAPGLGLAVGVRAHVAALAAAALLLALLLARRHEGASGWPGRLVLAAIAVIALTFVASTAAENLNLDASSEGLDEFLSETQRRTTGEDDSSVTGSPVSSPLDLPEATLRVLFRPLPHEASSPPMLLSAAETALLLALFLWRLPSIWRNGWRMRGAPFLLFASIYTAGFVVAFSAIFNLGILARQRVQVLPLFLALIVGLGWGEIAKTKKRAQPPALVSV